MTSYIGVDIGKKSLYLYLPVIDQSFEFNNNQQGFHKLLKDIKTLQISVRYYCCI